MTDQGWQDDPNDPTKLRYRDGSGWTDFTKPKPRDEPAPPIVHGGGPVRLPGSAPTSSAAPQPDPYAQQARPTPAADPYAQQAPPASPAHDPYAQQAPPAPPAPPAHDPYAQQAPPQGPPPGQPNYLQNPQERPGFTGDVHRFNDGIAQGYGDQSFGGQMTGPAGGRAAAPGRSMLNEKTLIVSQKRKIIEVTNEYAIYGADGAQLGVVAEVGQSSMRKVLRVMTNYDQFLTHRLEVRDITGQIVLQLTRPAKVMKSSVIVQNAQGQEIGRLVQRNVFGKIRFGIEADGQEIGSLNAENWRAWNFSMRDSQGTEVARVTKTWEGLLTAMFTTADNYAVNIHYDLPEPLRSLCLAAALTIDTALKQDDR
ncbi:phospholipid scramblase-related protein [Calidifontibacter terrae]